MLGKGALPKVPVIVKAKTFSKAAEKRIKEAGGACVLTVWTRINDSIIAYMEPFEEQHPPTHDYAEKHLTTHIPLLIYIYLKKFCQVFNFKYTHIHTLSEMVHHAYILI